MLLQFTLLSVYSWNVVHSYFSYIVCCSLPLQAIDHCFALIQVSDWVSERAVYNCCVCVLVGVHLYIIFTCSSMFFCCYLFVVLCLFVAAAASVFPFIGMSRISFHFFYSISKHKWKEEKTTVWLNVIHFGCSSLTRAYSNSLAFEFVFSFFLLLLSLLFVLLLFVRWIFIVN